MSREASCSGASAGREAPPAAGPPGRSGGGARGGWAARRDPSPGRRGAVRRWAHGAGAGLRGGRPVPFAAGRGRGADVARLRVRRAVGRSGCEGDTRSRRARGGGEVDVPMGYAA
jgi:hypothetical protein